MSLWQFSYLIIFSRSRRAAIMKILSNKNTTEVFSPKKLLPNAFAISCISSNKPHKRGIIFFSMTLLLFLLTANGVQAQPWEWDDPRNWNCQDIGLMPGQVNEWNPLTVLNHPVYREQRRVRIGPCTFEFTICKRELDVQPVPRPIPPLWEYFICKITIPPIPENDGCDKDNLDIIRDFNTIVDAYIPTFADWLLGVARLHPTSCSELSGHNIIRIGKPSCVTDPYVVTYFDADGNKSYREITHCIDYDSDMICFDRWKYCIAPGGAWTLTKVFDGSDGIAEHCPATKRVLKDWNMPDGYKDVACHPVCGNNQPATPTSVVETVIISSVSPNPTTNGTTLTLEVLTAGSLNIKLVNVEGQELMELHNAHTEAGEFTRNFTMSNLPQGVYYLRISHNGNVKMEKVIRN